MRLHKSVDEKLESLGFLKVKEDEYGASYERVTPYGYTQVLALLHKASGNHLLQSYQKDLNQDDFNNSAGLTYDEIKLALKKMKQIGLD